MRCAGDEQFWDRMSRESYGLIDLLKMIDSRNRPNRFATAGLINEPGFQPATKPDQYGLWIDEPVAGEGEPAGIDPKVYNYARESAEFPHEATSDQWFSESQFESYRALDQRTIEWIYSRASSPLPADSSRAEALTDFITQACAAAKTGPPPQAGQLFTPENPSADAGARN